MSDRLTIRNVFHFLLSGITALYLVLFVLWRVLLQTTLVDQSWSLQLSQVFAAWFYLPLALLLGPALILRARVALVMLAVPLVMFAGQYGRQVLPKWPLVIDSERAANDLRVMSWNTLFSVDRNGEFEATVLALEPDVVALQEVGTSLFGRLSEPVRALFPYQVVHLSGTMQSLAVLSRYPIVQDEAWTHWNSCRCQQVVIDWAGQPVTLINTHIWRPMIEYETRGRLPRIRYFNAAHQRSTFDALLARIDNVEGPLIVLGDLNTTEQQPNYQRVQNYLKNAFAVAGWGMGYTFPNPDALYGWRLDLVGPFIRIDHIFYDSTWQARRAWTGKIAGSDHLYVATDLRFQDNAPYSLQAKVEQEEH